MNKSHRLSHGAKKVTPPSIPSFNHRGSGSSFGSDYSYEREDSTFSRDPSGGNGNVPLQRSNLPKVKICIFVRMRVEGQFLLAAPSPPDKLETKFC